MTHPPTSTSTPASGDLPSPPNGPAFAPSPMPSPIPTPPSSSPTTGPTSPTSTTSAPSAFTPRLARLTSLQAACRASLRASLESGWAAPMSDGSGLTPSASFASFDPASQSLKTRQLSLALSLDAPSQESSVDWPRAGMMCSGESFPQPPWAQAISGSDSASSLPTPTAQDGERGGRGDLLAIARNKPNKHCRWALPTPKASLSSPDYARQEKRTKTHNSGADDLVTRIFRQMLPTPTTRDYKDTPGMSANRKDGTPRLDQLPRVIFADASPAPSGGMKLTPEFLCWLMGFPPNWLKPLRDALATPSSPKPSTPSSPPSAPKSDP